MNPPIKPMRHFARAVIVLLTAIAPAAFGAVATWTGGSATSANWTDGANWNGGAPSGQGVGTVLVFDGVTRTTVNNDASNGGTYGGGNYGDIIFNPTAGAFTINQGAASVLGLNGNLTNYSTNVQRVNVPMQLICANPGGNRVFFVAANGNLVVNAVVTENGGSKNGLMKAGAGALGLIAANSYSGGTLLVGGVLNVQAAGGLGAGDVSIGSGAKLVLGNAAGVNSGANVLLADGTATVNLAFSGTNAIHQLSFDGGATYEAPGTWGGPGSGAQNISSRLTGPGVFYAPAPLLLRIQTNGANVMISWPSAAASALSLCATTNLAAPNWQPVTNAVVTNGNLNIVTAPAAERQLFFQLRESVDPGTMYHKLLMGYQGWFGAPGDGSQNNHWFHWFRSQTPTAANATVDFLPDFSEFDADELFPTSMTYSNGQPFKLYSAYTQKTVLRHFKWMKDYQLDGVFLQRFVSELSTPSLFAFRAQVTSSVRLGSERYGRVFAIMYDISGKDTNTLVGALTNDWQYLTHTLKATESPRYLHHNGKPVVALWGFGFDGRSDTPQQAAQVIDYFKSAGCTVMGGLPTYWRTLNNDTQTNAAWAAVFRSFDIISPWSVGAVWRCAGRRRFSLQSNRAGFSGRHRSRPRIHASGVSWVFVDEFKRRPLQPDSPQRRDILLAADLQRRPFRLHDGLRGQCLTRWTKAQRCSNWRRRRRSCRRRARLSPLTSMEQTCPATGICASPVKPRKWCGTTFPRKPKSRSLRRLTQQTSAPGKDTVPGRAGCS